MKKCKWCFKWVWPWQAKSLTGKLCGYVSHVGCEHAKQLLRFHSLIKELQ
jgi:hypothetical protein